MQKPEPEHERGGRGGEVGRRRARRTYTTWSQSIGIARSRSRKVAIRRVPALICARRAAVFSRSSKAKAWRTPRRFSAFGVPMNSNRTRSYRGFRVHAHMHAMACMTCVRGRPRDRTGPSLRRTMAWTGMRPSPRATAPHSGMRRPQDAAWGPRSRRDRHELKAFSMQHGPRTTELR